MSSLFSNQPFRSFELISADTHLRTVCLRGEERLKSASTLLAPRAEWLFTRRAKRSCSLSRSKI